MSQGSIITLTCAGDRPSTATSTPGKVGDENLLRLQGIISVLDNAKAAVYPGTSTGRMSCTRRSYVAALGGLAGAPDLRAMTNMHWESLDFRMPSVPGRHWGRAIDTSRPSLQGILEPGRERPIAGDRDRVGGRSVVALISQESSTHIGAGGAHRSS
jgi:hypothetical protein